MGKTITRKKEKDGMPDYIDKKRLNEKLFPSTQTYDQEDKVSLFFPVDRKLDSEVQHVPPALKQNGTWAADPQLMSIRT